MGQLRTANKRHNRAIAAARTRSVAVGEAPAILVPDKTAV